MTSAHTVRSISAAVLHFFTGLSLSTIDIHGLVHSASYIGHVPDKSVGLGLKETKTKKQ